MADTIYVLDASVVVPWFFTDEPRRVDALVARDAGRQQPERFVVPPLFHSEFVHVMARKAGREERFVAQATALMLAIGVRTVSLPEAALLRTAHWA